MSLTMTISSWPSSNTVVSTSSGRSRSPANASAYARATRRGVPRSPSRSGSSPMAISSSRTAASTRDASNSLIRPRVPHRRGAVGLRAGRRATARPVAAGGAGQPGDVLGPEQRELARRHHRGLVRRQPLARPGVGAPAGPLLDRGEDLENLLLGDGLLVHQAQDQVVEDVAVLDEDLPRLVVRRLDEPADLEVDGRGDVLGVVPLVA